MSELVSIIVPTRNRSRVLIQCLQAILNQANGIHRCEILVVDDCSTDRTREVVQGIADPKKFPIRWIGQPQPRGANAARNRGLEIARGEIIIFLDDDVLVPPGWLEKLVAGLDHTGCPVVTGAVRLTVGGCILGKHREEVGPYLSEVLEAARGIQGEIVPVACNMAGFRWVFDRARFDETLRPPVEEVDWLRRAGVAAGFVPEAWAWHYKTREELRLGRVLRGAWQRGGEGGWWMRERLKMPSSKRLPLTFRAAKNCARAIGHALVRRCWGGVVISLGELSKAMALVGLSYRGNRLPGSWR